MNGWISIKDRLPDNQDTVLIWEKHYGFGFGYLSADGWWIFCHSDGYEQKIDNHVDYWMPLPEKPNDVD